MIQSNQQAVPNTGMLVIVYMFLCTFIFAQGVLVAAYKLKIFTPIGNFSS